jgi:hypothetical protein
MSGRFLDVWQFVWPEIWLELEQSDIWTQLAESSGYSPDDLYMDVYVEFAKALKKAPQPDVYDATANDPVLARAALETATVTALRCETATVRFFENAFEAISEAGSGVLEDEYRQLVSRFISSRNLRYELIEPFELRSHVVGVFAALLADITAATSQHPQIEQAFRDFAHSFRSLQRSHLEADMKTCIQKAGMVVEALASVRPDARGNNFGALCNSVRCWPNPLVREAVKKLYEFSSDFPGIRHNIVRRNAPRPLEIRDSIIVPLLLLTAAGYFGPSANILDALRSEGAEPRQEAPDLPTMAEPVANASLP